MTNEPRLTSNDLIFSSKPFTFSASPFAAAASPSFGLASSAALSEYARTTLGVAILEAATAARGRVEGRVDRAIERRDVGVNILAIQLIFCRYRLEA